MKGWVGQRLTAKRGGRCQTQARCNHYQRPADMSHLRQLRSFRDPAMSVTMQAGAAKDKAAGATGGDNPIGNFIDQAKAGADRVRCLGVMQHAPGVVQLPAGSPCCVCHNIDPVRCFRCCHPA